jgi:hypothetical protein
VQTHKIYLSQSNKRPFLQEVLMKSSKFTMGALSLSVLATVALSAPSFAQTAGSGSSSSTPTDAFSSFTPGNAGTANPGYTGNGGMSPLTGTQTGPPASYGVQSAPMLQGASNATIGPQGSEATYVMGVNTAGTVRVNNLANLEALLNIIANGMEILGIAWGGPTMIMGFMHMAAGTQDAMKRVLFGAAGVTGGLATPGCINWLVASARDANLFS